MYVQILLSIPVTLWFSFIYVGVGDLVIKKLKLNESFSQELSFVIRFALGFGIIGNLITLMGFFNLYSSVAIIILLITLTVVSLSSVYSDLPNLIPFVKSIPSRLPLSHNKFWTAFALLLLIGYTARGLLPPTGFDTLMYHLSTVKLYLQEGGFWDIFFNPQSDYPMLSQMHYLTALAIGNDIICKGISTILFFLHLTLIYHISIDLSQNRKSAFFSVLIFATLPTIVANASSCYVDIHQSLWSLLSVSVLLKFYENKNYNILLIAAFCAGMAVQTKIIGIFIVPILISIILYQKRGKTVQKSDVWEMSAIIIIPSIMGAVWFFKSHLFNQTVLSSMPLSADMQGRSAVFTMTSFIGRFITAPWTYTIFPSFHRGDTFGPIMLMVLPFIVFLKRDKKVNIYLLAAAVYLLQIIFMDTFVLNTSRGTSGRYVIFILAVLVPLVPYTLKNIRYIYVKNVLNFCVIVSILLGGGIFFKRYNKDWIALLTIKSRNEYYSLQLPEYDVIQKINSLTTNKKVLLAYNFSEYLIDLPYIVAYKKYNDSEEMVFDLKSNNVGYIFANNKFDTLENQSSFSEINEYIKPIYNSKGFYLFRFHPSKLK
ncbi:hypothetical protein CHISP_2121 [Chitinispirillum alkaliphilum]|nr:hypothetical protein CHISP_2121 [Chitinispirillum alkaliphilum]